MNKFQLVSDLGQQMSPVGRGVSSFIQGNKFEQVSNLGHQTRAGLGESLYREVQGTMGNSHIGTPCGQTDRHE